MIQGDVGRRAQHDEDARAIDGEGVQHRRIGLEVRQVVLLLEPGIAQELGRAYAEAREPLGWDRIRHDHLRRRTHTELMLQLCELVVVRRRARNAQTAGGQRQLVRAVCKRKIEVARARPGV